MDHAILNAVRDSDRDAFSGSKLGSSSALQLELGAARYEWYTGCRHLINQHRPGTVSCHMLLEILKRRSEHPWTCFVCNEDDPITNYLINR